MTFRIIFRQWAGSFRLLVEFFDGNCILRVQGEILTKTVLFQSLFIFGHWAIFLTNSRKKVAELSKLDSQFQWKLSGENVLETLKIVYFWISSGKFSAGCPKKVSRPSQRLSTSPWEQFEENVFEKFLHLLWTFFRIISVNWAGKVWPACENFFFCIYRNILKKKLFWKTNEFFCPFQTVSRKFRPLVYFLVGFLQLHSMGP